MKRVISMKTLKGVPNKISIHLFVPDEQGSFTEAHVLQEAEGKVTAAPSRGRIACNTKLDATPKTIRGVVNITQRTDDPRAVTCPHCIASEIYKKKVERLQSLATEK